MTDENRTKLKRIHKFASMKHEKLYSTPTLKRGKEVDASLKGALRKKAQAAQDWYVEFNFYDPITEKTHRKKIREGINYIKDYQQKELEANKLLNDVIGLLEDGWNPFDFKSNQHLLKDVISISISEALVLFNEHNTEIGTRRKSISSYNSKLKLFANFYPNLKLNKLTEWHIEEFLKSSQNDRKWTSITFNAAKTILGIFCNFLVKKKYITHQLTKDISAQKTTNETLKHNPITDEHFEMVKDYLINNDLFTYLFILTIHYTCIRPKELRALQLRMIDFESNTITIPSEIAKNRKSLPIEIDSYYKSILLDLGANQFPRDYYLFTLSSTIIGINPVGENTPLNRFTKCLNVLKLENYNYTLYSFKHRSNIKRYLNGWTIEQIMKANRHASPLETERYLRGLGLFVSISGLQVPSF